MSKPAMFSHHLSWDTISQSRMMQCRIFAAWQQHHRHMIIAYKKSHIRGLKSLGISATSYGSLLSSILMNKLLPEFQLIISQTVTGENWELDTLLQIVEMEISARERSETVLVHCTRQNQRSIPTVTFMSDNSTTSNCVYCNESHTPLFCTLNTRKDVLKSSGRCFICLQKGHLAVNC